MLQRIDLRNYRSFRSVSVTFDNPTFLVGANGAGKSNFADAISFLSLAMILPLASAFGLHRGFERVAHRHAKGRSSVIGFHMVMKDLDDSVAQAEYTLRLRRRRDLELEVALERCVVEEHDGTVAQFRRETPADSERGVRWRGNIDAPKLARSTLALPLVGDVRFTPVFDFLADMHTYSIDPSTLRDQEPYGQEEHGGDVARTLRQMEIHSPDDWEEVCELLAIAVPGLVGVQARKRRGKLVLEFLQDLHGRTARFNASDMSDGTLRMLGILVAAYQRPAPSLMVIEEPEASIHPGALGVILDVLWGASRSSQVVVTTHCPEILDAKWIRDRHLRLVSWDDGATRIDKMAPWVKRAMAQQLFGAGELLRSNALDERT